MTMNRHIIIKTVTALFCSAVAMHTYAQPKFITAGKVEYEKSVNIKKQLEENEEMPDVFKNTKQDIVKSYFDLSFANNQSVYKKGREAPNSNMEFMWWGGNTDPVTYINTDSGKISAMKNVFGYGETYLQDSLMKIDWRITFDTRTIAGFECRKAVGRLFDSLYVVAFYSDEILVPSGPESFAGLPGMILGLAIPRLHMTWFATKVELNTVKPEDVKAPAAGRKTKKYTYPAAREMVLDRCKEWGVKDSTKRVWNMLY
jgi:GLPGLI family protein